MQAFIRRWSREGYAPEASLLGQVRRAAGILGFVSDTEPEQVNARWGDLSLALSLPAGERLALECAQWQMDARAKKKGFEAFLFGCNFFNYAGAPLQYAQKFLELCNYATLPFYWSGFESTQGKPDFASVDALADYLQPKGIRMKGHPLLWMHTMPQWAAMDDPEKLKAQLGKRVSEIVGHYRGRVGVWDIINEIQHVNPFTPDDAIELTRFVSERVRENDRDAVRVVNVDEPFGEYMARQPSGGMHPLTYFERLEKENVQYEAIGLQVYHGAGWTYCRDLFEMSRYLDRYEKFHKRVHLSEIGVPSREGYDHGDYSWHDGGAIFPADMRFKASDAGFWHGPWDQRNQADWAEGFYRILMGKPFVDAITWWDLSDFGSHFYTFAGLLDEGMKPKEAFTRLKALRDRYLPKPSAQG